jgi:molecular chaperone DnaJ
MKVYFTASEVLTQAEKTIEFVREANCKDCDGHGYHRDIANMCSRCGGAGHTFTDTHTPFGSIKTEKECGTCDGTGYFQREDCQTCHTKGKVSEAVKITFPIPDGVTEGFQMRIRDKGDAGLNGGKNGDLFIVFQQSVNDTYVIRNKYDLAQEILVPFETALLGGEITISLPNGKKVKMPINKGIKNRNLINIPDGGLYDPERKQYGMFIGTLYIDVPTTATDEDAKEILKRLNKEGAPVT